MEDMRYFASQCSVLLIDQAQLRVGKVRLQELNITEIFRQPARTMDLSLPGAVPAASVQANDLCEAALADQAVQEVRAQ